MKRFNFDDEDESEEDPEKFMGPEFFSMAQFPLDSPTGILDLSIKICEKSFFWKFYNIQTKLNKIKQAYNFLRELEEEI